MLLLNKLAVGSYTSPGTNALSVTGNVNMPGCMFAAGLVSAAGSKISGTGQVVWTVSLISTGYYLITFPTAHPLGANYIANVTAQGCWTTIRGSSYAPTSTTFQLASYQIGTTTLQNCVFSCMVHAS